MKFWLLPLLLLSLPAGAQQDTGTVTMHKDQATRQEILETIRVQTGHLFAANGVWLQRAGKVNIHVNRMPYMQVLDKFFKTRLLTYDTVGGVIVINPQPIRGKVYSEAREPLESVSVTIAGTANTVVTNREGEFTLNSNATDPELVFSSVNMKPLTRVIRDREVVYITMQPLVSRLDDVEIVVNTGYQRTTREKTPSAVAGISNEMFNLRVSADIQERLEGTVSGLLLQKNREPNANQPEISIRSQTTIHANPDPLIVIDNLPYEGKLSSVPVNPNDVENISVLKDAAASVWGAISANGVIVITTKKGQFNQPLRVNFNSNISLVDKPDLYYLPVLNPQDFIAAEENLFDKGYYFLLENHPYRLPLSPVIETRIRLRDGLISANEAGLILDSLRRQDTRYYLNKYFQRTGLHQQYALNLSGGNNKKHYYISGGWDKNLQTQQRSNYDRKTINAHLTYALTKNLTVSTGILYTAEKTSNAGGLPFIPYTYIPLADAYGNARVVPADVRQSLKDTAGKDILLDWDYRPLDELYLTDITNTGKDLRVTMDIQYSFSKRFSSQLLLQYTAGTDKLENFHSLESYFTRNLVNRFSSMESGTVTRPVPAGGIYDFIEKSNHSEVLRYQLNYKDRFKTSDTISAFAGVEIRNIEGENETGRLYGFNKNQQTDVLVDYANRYPLFFNTALYERIPGNRYITTFTNRYISLFMKADYTFRDKYTFSATIRKEHSNIYGSYANRRLLPLWSAGGLWDITKENFYSAGNWLPKLKLRVSFGYNGNFDKSVMARTTIRIAGPDNQGNPVAGITNPPNPSLSWEKTSTANIGIDFATKNSRITGSIDIYYRKGTDLIGNILLDPTTGDNILKGNGAGMRSHGADITIQTVNINSKLKWHTLLLFTHAVDKVTRYLKNDDPNWKYADARFLHPLEGRPVHAIMSFPWAGLDPQNGDPQGYYNNQVSKDYLRIISSDNTGEMTYHGPANPSSFGSVRNTFTWRRFKLSFLITGKFGYYFRNHSITYNDITSLSSPGSADYNKRWQQPGDERHTYVPSLPAVPSPLNYYRDEFYKYSAVLVEKGDHIRLQDINFQYQFSPELSGKLRLQQLHLYASAANLGILWKATRTGIDPDFISIYPNPLKLSIGIKATY